MNPQKVIESHVIKIKVLNLIINQYKLKTNNRNTLYNINTSIIAHVAEPYTF
jgi:hypothetical protein